MLTSETKNKINRARDVLVGKIPDPKSQIDQITNALIYKFMDDQDRLSMSVPGGKASFFVGELEEYSWHKLFDSKLSNQDRANLYSEGLNKLSNATKLPDLFKDIFKNAYLPFRAPDTVALFLDEINQFDYHHSEELGNAFEYLLSIMGSQGDAGQFRTPRHIIEFVVKAVSPKKDETILDPACGTAGFLVEAFNQIKNSSKLTPQELQLLANNIEGFDIDPGMAKIARVNLYLHGFKTPHISENDTLTNENLWLKKKYDVILANPPFMSPKGGIKPHDKFSVKANKSEVLFVNYIAEHLKLHGRAGIIVPEGIIFQSGNAYKQLRKTLVEDGYLSAVVSLPSGIFNPYSGVKTSILILDREKAKSTDEILFVKVENTGISLGSTNATVKENDLPQALLDIKDFSNGINLDSKISFPVKKDAIKDRDYDLSLSKYKIDIVSQDSRVVFLKEISTILKGLSSSTKTLPGDYKLYLTAEDCKTSDHYDFEGEGVAVPLISALGHGKAEVKRIHKVGGKFALANLLAFVKPDSSVCLPAYFWYFLDSKKKELSGLMSGSANVSMKVSDLENFKIILPPLEIQEEIVAELDSYQKIIDGAKQVVENWRPEIDIDSKWGKVKFSEILEFIGSGATPLGGKDVYQDNGVLFIRSQNVLWGETDFSDAVFISNEINEAMKRSEVKENDVLFNITGASIGRCAVFDKSSKANVNQHVTILRCNKKMLPRFLMVSLLGKELQNEIWKMQGGASRQALNYQQIRNFMVAVPSLDIQKQVVEKIEAEKLLVESNKKLIEIYEQKMKDVISKLWN